jgi:hypothetical protein
MPLIKVSNKSFAFLSDLKARRRESGELPLPTMASLVEEIIGQMAEPKRGRAQKIETKQEVQRDDKYYPF